MLTEPATIIDALVSDAPEYVQFTAQVEDTGEIIEVWLTGEDARRFLDRYGRILEGLVIDLLPAGVEV
jgi:predicted RNA-binding protein YlqC (UPF0109 family)